MEAEIEKRVSLELQKRLLTEVDRQKEYIESEIQRRVVEAKKLIEKEMIEELEKQKQIEFKKQLEKEVCSIINMFIKISHLNIKKHKNKHNNTNNFHSNIL
jgi:hypothetical protein